MRAPETVTLEPQEPHHLAEMVESPEILFSALSIGGLDPRHAGGAARDGFVGVSSQEGLDLVG